MKAVCLLAAALATGTATGQTPGGASAPAPPVRTTSAPFQVRSGVNPAIAELGQRVVYQGWVVRPGQPAFARWLPPDTSAAFTWGSPTVLQRDWVRRRRVDATKRYSIDGRETLFVEIPLQAFVLGRLSLPGLKVEIDDGRGPRIYRLPMTTLTVVPVLTAADSNADFRALHGPLAAPWWERVPWTWVVLGLLLAASVVLIVAWWRRRRGASATPATAPAARDPRTEALAALAVLRGLHLPEHSRFAEHAFRLGQILRRYLEALIATTRPGDTTPELVAHLRHAGIEPEDLTRLAGLLRVWDQVKFAREPHTLDEAIRAERATEAFLRRPATPAAAAPPGPQIGKVA